MDKLIEVSLKGQTKRASGFVPPGVPGNNPDLQPLPYDPEQARKLLSESKYGSAADLPEVTYYVLYSTSPLDDAMVAMWKQNLGVDVKVEVVTEPEEWYKRRHDHDIPFYTSGWRADYLDPQNFLEVLFDSQSEENDFAYNNPAVDAALKEAAVEQDPEKRLKMYQEIEKVILNDLPAVPLFCNETSHILVKPYLKELPRPPLLISGNCILSNLIRANET